MPQAPRCPICDGPVDPVQSPAMPFCSVRCQQIDLGRWLDERYGMPHQPNPDDEEDSGDSEPTFD